MDYNKNDEVKPKLDKSGKPIEETEVTEKPAEKKAAPVEHDPSDKTNATPVEER